MVNRAPVAGEFVSLREAMDRLLTDSFVGGPFRALWSSPAGNGGGAQAPLPLDVYATADEAVIIAAVPGLNPDQVEITWNQGTVTISGQLLNVAASEEGKQATWFVHELPNGAFRRSVTLPFDVDTTKAEATFEHGVLKLRLPKAEQAKPKQIKIRVAGATESLGATAGAENGTAQG